MKKLEIGTKLKLKKSNDSMWPSYPFIKDVYENKNGEIIYDLSWNCDFFEDKILRDYELYNNWIIDNDVLNLNIESNKLLIEQKLIVSDVDLGCTNWENANKLCSDYRGGGFDDWRLPTKDELNKIYLLHKTGVGGFVAYYYYWSSSETSSYDAWGQGFTNGDQTNYAKNVYNYIRAVRGF